jgi:DNA polymerase elongation subunit (family B)/DNA-directed RNA polymerase subunit RPC12/RpoP
VTKSKPKILLLDIETGPGIAYFWNLYDDNIPLDRLIEPGRMLCYAAKWVGQPTIYFGAEWLSERKVMLTKLRDLLSEADAVITYNGDKFDFVKIAGELIVHGVKPCAPVTSIDLYKVVRKLGFASGKLDYVAPFLKIGRKTKHAGFRLWREVLAGDKKAQLKMTKYNIQDTRLLEGLYKTLRPYMQKHPHLRSTSGSYQCANCGSNHLQHRGHRYNRTTKVERLECQKCGAWNTGKRSKV